MSHMEVEEYQYRDEWSEIYNCPLCYGSGKVVRMLGCDDVMIEECGECVKRREYEEAVS